MTTPTTEPSTTQTNTPSRSTGAPPSGSAAAAVLAGWQRALAGEQQAAFGFALLGPSAAAAFTDDVRAAQALHESLRDRVAGLIAAAGADPAAPQGDYPALYPMLTAPLLLAAALEDACAEGWRFLYAGAAATTPGDATARRLAQQQLTASAVRAVRWRIRAGDATPVTAFPGI